MNSNKFYQLRSIAKEALSFSMLTINGFCMIQATRNYLFDLGLIEGPSMLPAINLTGDVVLVDRVSPRQGKIGRGDVVMVRSPEKPTKVVTKRLVAMEGDTVTFIADPNNNGISKSVVVPKGHVWVQGDNVYDSRDSRHFGAVPYALLYGRICWRMGRHGTAQHETAQAVLGIWPLKEFGSIPTNK